MRFEKPTSAIKFAICAFYCVLGSALAEPQLIETEYGCHRALRWLDRFNLAYVYDDGVRIHSNGVENFVNGIRITGDLNHPVAQVLSSLQIAARELKDWRTKRVLEVAPGFARGLMETLLGNKIDADALEIWFGRKVPMNYDGRQMKAFEAWLGKRAIAGSAFKMPISSESYDVIVSHAFANNIEHADAMKFLRESYRILRPGGELRVDGFSEVRVQQAIKALQEEFGDKVTTERVYFEQDWMDAEALRHESMYLLKLFKKN